MVSTWKQVHNVKRAKLATKLQISLTALDKRVLRRANRRHISPAAALLEMAHEEGMAINRDFQRLSPDDQASLRSNGNTSIVQNVTNSHHVSQQAHQRSTAVRRAVPKQTVVLPKRFYRQGWFKWLAGIVSGVIVIVASTLIIRAFG